jgi:hypothetical protein
MRSLGAPVPSDGAVSTELGAVARALSWHMALNAMMERASMRYPWRDENLRQIVLGAAPNTTYCELRIDGDVPQFPRRAAEGIRAGAVVALFRLDDSGAVTSRDVLALAPLNSDYAESVRSRYPSWGLARRPNSPANCVMPRAVLVGEDFDIDP